MSPDHVMAMNPASPMSYDDGNMNMSSSSMEMVMHMSFYWGKDAIILLSGWPKHSLGMYVLAFFVVFFLAMGIEIFSLFPTVFTTISSKPTVVAFSQASVYAVKMGFAYLVMLAVMSFNVGIFIAAVAGHALGHFIVKARTPAVAHRQDINGDDSIPKV